MRKCNSVFGHYLGCNGPDTFANGDWAFLKVGFVFPDRILTTSPPSMRYGEDVFLWKCTHSWQYRNRLSNMGATKLKEKQSCIGKYYLVFTRCASLLFHHMDCFS
ncbi:hypothetical protein Bca4012_051204 [Brassica carinata]|uniref:Uncharacterized protein n=2 Tax=Brassica TaxID=3705 RepID=A0A0D3AT37_BRAOL|nr:unnamed protein product [Brassica napus]